MSGSDFTVRVGGDSAAGGIVTTGEVFTHCGVQRTRSIHYAHDSVRNQRRARHVSSARRANHRLVARGRS